MNDPLVLSFDLDDTLWAVEPVILAAEAAMLAWLREQHPLIDARAQTVNRCARCGRESREQFPSAATT